MILTGANRRLGRGFALLAPELAAASFRPPVFAHSNTNPKLHRRLLAGAQRLRGRVYLRDGAIHPSQLSTEGRYIQDVDSESWHLLTIDSHGRVAACIRYRALPPDATYDDLGIRETFAAQTDRFARRVRRAVETELAKASHFGFTFVELGGWVVSEELRCTSEAIRMLLVMYALSQSLGGAIAISTATTRHSSSSILRRIGGTSLGERDGELPPYYDSSYGCEMELLAFDSRRPNPRYTGWVREFREALHNIPLISPSALQAGVCERPGGAPVSQATLVA
jgi:hypothetical protein